MRKYLILIIPLILCACTTGEGDFNYDKLNLQAQKEYLNPVRPGSDGQGYWNIHARKFIFAPVFDFKEDPDASRYRFVIRSGAKEYSFTSDTPNSSMAPVWNDVPVGDAMLRVIALDEKGDSIREVGSRGFFRDFPFSGPYPPAARSYKECAIRALLFIHNIPAIGHWAETGEPDMNYLLNIYPCKNVSATICCELMLSQLVPSCAGDARKVALNAGEWLLKACRPEGDPLAFFPPTYYSDALASGLPENQGVMMTMEPCKASLAFLDLYDATGDERYMTRVKEILETYRRLQSEDGTYPMKITFAGDAYNAICARPDPLLNLIFRMDSQYGICEWEDIRVKCEKWMDEYAIPIFDMTGQFEDIQIDNIELYDNMTHWSALPYAIHMMERGNLSADQLAVCKDLIDFAEDQFVYWDSFANEDGIHVNETPSVGEQYFYMVPIDDSAGIMSIAWMDYYLVTGDKLALAKAKAMVDSITRVQSAVTGMIPTGFESSWGTYNNDYDLVWISCNLGAILAVLKYDQITGGDQSVQDLPIDYHMRQMMF